MKTLWLGCSHSAGVYDRHNNLINDNGIPVRVLDNLNIEECKIVTTPGNGLYAYSRIIDYLSKQQKLTDVSNIILQLTDEPRLLSCSRNMDYLILKQLNRYMTFSDDIIEERVFHYHSSYRTHSFEDGPLFSHHAGSLYQMYEHLFNTTKQKKLLLDISESIQEGITAQLEHISYMASDNIIKLVKKHNIDLYTFLYRNNDYSNFNYENTELSEYDIFSDNLKTTIVGSTPHDLRSGYYHKSYGHPLDSGVNYASDIITSALKTFKFTR